MLLLQRLHLLISFITLPCRKSIVLLIGRIDCLYQIIPSCLIWSLSNIQLLALYRSSSASIITEGKLSNLQLEAVVYGCQRHSIDMPTAPRDESNTVEAPVAARCGFRKSMDSVTDWKGYDLHYSLPWVNGSWSNVDRVSHSIVLGDSAGMGKGRTLAGFVAENISRGRKRHVWISVANDLRVCLLLLGTSIIAFKWSSV